MMNNTRQRILHKTAELLEVQGYHATGLNQIVRESGTPRGSLYYYFPNGKEELAAEAVLDSAQRMKGYATQTLAAIADPAEAVYQFVLQLADHSEDQNCQGGAPLATVALEAPATSERLRHACQEAYAEMRRPFEEKLTAAGLPPTRAASLATLITAALEGGVILTRANHNADPLRQIAAELRTLLAAT